MRPLVRWRILRAVVPWVLSTARKDNDMVTRIVVLVALTASVLTLSSCEPLDSKPQPWVGGSIDEAMRVQGAPSETTDLSPQNVHVAPASGGCGVLAYPYGRFPRNHPELPLPTLYSERLRHRRPSA